MFEKIIRKQRRKNFKSFSKYKAKDIKDKNMTENVKDMADMYRKTIIYLIKSWEIKDQKKNEGRGKFKEIIGELFS